MLHKEKFCKRFRKIKRKSVVEIKMLLKQSYKILFHKILPMVKRLIVMIIW